MGYKIFQTVSLLFIAFVCEINCLAPGYSYARFMGPVSGPEKKVLYDDGKYHQHDYVAKPDYHFAYGVEDPKSKVHQSRQETRHGDTVEGQYRCDSMVYYCVRSSEMIH